MRTTDTDQRFTRRNVREGRREEEESRDNYRVQSRGTRVREARRIEQALTRAGVRA